MMTSVSTYLEARPVVTLDKITISKALEVIQTLELEILPFARLVECRIKEDADIVIIEVQPQLVQKRVYPIKPREILAIEFDREDRIAPWVFVLRDDFPIVPHLNLMPSEFPRCLCIYEENYRQQKRYWTAAKFIEDIRRWLTLTSKGELHDEEQALEPMILNSPVPLMVPSDLLQDGTDGFAKLVISGIKEEGLLSALEADKWDGAIQQWSAGYHLGIILTCPPQEHGIIRRQPSTLKELNDLTLTVGFDLIEALSVFLLGIRQEQNALAYPLVFILLFPKVRKENGPIEIVDKFAFMSRSSILEIGEEIGIWARPDGFQNVGLIQPRDQAKTGEAIKLLLLNLNFKLSRQRAAMLNGFSNKSDIKGIAIGAGALGSHVLMNLIRSGFGLWSIVDNDRLLPHNLARHAMPGAAGFAKSSILSEFLNTITPDEPATTYINADLLDPGEQAAKLEESLRKSDLILDMSANTSVGRHIAHTEAYSGRRVSVFLNPAGTDLVCLAEDTARRIKLDHLDLQYYRAIIQNPKLAGHLYAPSRLRYGQTCRDLSSTIPQDYVALLSAIASRTIRNLESHPEAAIKIWHIESELNVTLTNVPPVDMIEIPFGEWRLLTDSVFLEKVFDSRAQRLPRETGGILIGSWDMERKIVYVVDMLPAPPDSVERNTLFIRGYAGLAEQIIEIEQKTLWELGYVGEWHSHPNGASCNPSSDDLEVLDWLKDHMGAVGLPGLMMIACENWRTSWFLGDQTAYNITFGDPIPL